MPVLADGSLEIARIDVFEYKLDYVGGSYEMSGGRVITGLPSTVVRITTRRGTTGFGEACPLGPAYLPGFGKGVHAVLRELCPQLLGADAANGGAINLLMDGALSGHGYAKSAVDVACWDALGKATGVPMSTLLGGTQQALLPLYLAVSWGEPEAMVEFVERKRDEGIRKFQLKVGGVASEAARAVSAVVDVVDDGDLVVVDPNCGWRVQDAVMAARLMEDMPIHLEQPCPSLEECFAVRQRTNLPFVLDEAIVDVHTLLRAHTHNGLEALNLKISRFGGLTKARLVRDLAVSLGLKVTIEDTWGGDIATAAVSHLAASTRADALLMASFFNDWTTGGHFGGHQPRSADGFGSAPTGPGLGIEIDEDLLGEPAMTFR